MDVTLELSRTTCWCGTPFAIPKALLNSAHESKHTIYCPHGHEMSWKESEADRLRRERDRLKQREAMLGDEKRAAVARAERAEAATKRLKKRAAAGTCPCCHRTFSNMGTHMRNQHPQFVAEQTTNVVKLNVTR